MMVDHNRVIIDVDIPLSDGVTQRVRAWVDNGTTDLWMNQRVAGWMGLDVTCDGQVCSAPPKSRVVSLEIAIGGMKVSLPAIGEIKVIANNGSLAPGTNAEINIPSTVLRNHDVLINFPEQQLTIGQPGSLKFNGVKSKMFVNPANGLIQIPARIENKNYNLGLDVGSAISFLAADLFDKLSTTHPDWPQTTGAIGPANMLGSQDELKQKLMRVERLQYGPLFLTGVAATALTGDAKASLEKAAGTATAGLVGANALTNYRIGLNYAHSAAFFDIGRTFKFPDFDVVGLVLRPQDDGRFSIAGVADFEGKPSVPEVQAGDFLVAVDGTPVPGSTMGQVWLMLGGSPGQERLLTIERGGKQFTVAAKVQHFLGEESGKDESGRRSKKK